MLVQLSRSEMWPVYSVAKAGTPYWEAPSVEIPATLLIDYRRVSLEFERIQKELHAIYEKAVPK